MDAISIACRHLDEVFAKRSGRLVLLDLDWAKASDSIMPEPMFTALKCFSLPDAFIYMLKGIYTSHMFYIQDASGSFDSKHRHASICQGCPRSPVIFVIVMSVFIADVRRDFETPH